jgi:hypothetical protein
MNPDYNQIVSLQRDFFALLDDSLKTYVNIDYRKHSDVDSFIIALKEPRRATFASARFAFLVERLHDFYRVNAHNWFGLAKRIGGLKLAYGGGNRFTESHIESIRKILLYADTIFVPDPVLPWIEKQRIEERFSKVLLLKSIWLVLQLRPFIDANLPFPAIVVFPSFEKSLEETDQVTKGRQSHLIAATLSKYLGTHFSTMEETFDYAYRQPHDFLAAVERGELFWAPGAECPQPLEQALPEYRAYLAEWRAGEAKLEGAPDSIVVWMGVVERIAPFVHAYENCFEFDAHPLFAFDAHWHYHSMVSSAINDSKLLPETVPVARSLTSDRLKWLGNIAIPDLVMLRENNENEVFRKTLHEQLSILSASSAADLNRVTNEVSRAISSLLAGHNKVAKEIHERYQSRYKQTLTATVLTAPAIFFPLLQPFAGLIPPLSSALKYMADKSEELYQFRLARKSLMGILSKAAQQ